MSLTQEPTFVTLMVVTQEPTMRKIASTHAFQNQGMIYCYIPSSCKAPVKKPKVLKRINA